MHAEAFGKARPAATTVVTGLLDARMRVEIEAVAYAPSADAEHQPDGAASPV